MAGENFTVTDFAFAVINTSITLPVIALNVFVVHFYKNDFRKFVPCIYLLISMCDGLTAAFALINSSLIMRVYWSSPDQSTLDEDSLEMLQPPTDQNIPDEMCYALIISTTGWEVFYRVSVYLNLLLSIARTIKIKSPFFQIKTKAALLSLAVYSALWLAIALVDIVQAKISKTVLYVKEGKLGLTIGAVLFLKGDIENGTYYGATTKLILIVIPFIIPAFLSCICLGMLAKSLSQTAPSQQSAAKQRHVTVTVTYLTLLFCVCNSVSTLYFLFAEYIYELFLNNDPISGHGIFTAVFSLTVPLLNAAISPLIIITRSTELTSRIRQHIQGAIPTESVSHTVGISEMSPNRH